MNARRRSRSVIAVIPHVDFGRSDALDASDATTQVVRGGRGSGKLEEQPHAIADTPVTEMWSTNAGR